MRTEGQLFIIVGNYIINIQETEINHYKLLDIMKASELRIGNLVFFEDEILKFDFEGGEVIKIKLTKRDNI
jgi:hypothetical protein